MDEQPAPEEGAELALDEAGQSHPVGARGGGGEEGLQVLPDHSVQDRVGGSAWDVGSLDGLWGAYQWLDRAPRAATNPPTGGATTTATERGLDPLS